jgi:hypothetical protein
LMEHDPARRFGTAEAALADLAAAG